MSKVVNVRVEIMYGDKIKYEIDHKSGQLIVDRFLHTPFAYPFNYGYIENTMSGDGDPLDAVIVCKHPILPTSLIKCRIIGALETSDEKGQDEKVILVPDTSVDPYNKDIHEIDDLDNHTMDEIKYFFEHYKDLEKGKHVEMGKILDSKDAFKLYLDCLEE